MKAEYKIKRELIKRCWDAQESFRDQQSDLIKVFEEFDVQPPGKVVYGEWLLMDEERIEEIYNVMCEADFMYDYESEFRYGTDEPDFACYDGGHYEARNTAAQMMDGSWVGWTFYYGGGKHGEPGAVEWIPYAYDVKVTEEEKLVVVRTWEKVGK